MGQYLSVSLAKNIYIKKECPNEKFENIKEIKKNFDLSLYDISESNDFFVLEMKHNVFEKEIVNLMEEICQNATERHVKFIKERINKIKGKSYEEIMDIGKETLAGFAYMEGNLSCNDIFYLLDKHWGFCDAIVFLFDGEIRMEFRDDLFTYLRNNIVNNLKNPLRQSVVITIT